MIVKSITVSQGIYCCQVYPTNATHLTPKLINFSKDYLLLRFTTTQCELLFSD